jgi:DNA mismatch endonuclease (patch repair protein)
MTDVFTREKRSQVMARVKGKNTTPELAVRRLLTRMGLRYRLHRADLPGKPDVVMAGRKTVVCVHGCFWHGHDCARGARMPKANNAYWQAKIGRNRERDERARSALAADGWKTITVWECELKDEPKLEKRLKKAIPRA